MAISKKQRQIVYNKYGGLCAYTGKPLGTDWQVDHKTSIQKHRYNTFAESGSVEEALELLKKVNDIDNLMPVVSIVNHYKRAFDLESFRVYMYNFHNRLAKLPKRTMLAKTKKRIEYMQRIAILFDITPEKPFNGHFYFETLN